MPAAHSADAADAVFAALSDPTRRGLYALLAGAGLVATRRSGREVLYRPTPAPMSEALEWMAEVGSQWDDRLAALERQLARGRTLTS